MKFSGGDWKLDLRPRMLQKSIEKIIEKVSRHPRSSSEGQSDLETFVVPSPDGTPRLGVVRPLYKIELKGVKV